MFVAVEICQHVFWSPSALVGLCRDAREGQSYRRRNFGRSRLVGGDNDPAIRHALALGDANGRQAAGLSTDHYARALQVGRLIGLSGNRNVTITGHSLVGGLASAAGLAAGLPTTTFNASGLSAATISAANGIRATTGRSEADIRAYYVRGEILSTIQDGGDRVAGSLLGRALGSILGPAGGVAGGIAGAQVDAPEAYGTRIALDPVRPEGTHWWDQHAANFHRMPWVLAALGAQ